MIPSPATEPDLPKWKSLLKPDPTVLILLFLIWILLVTGFILQNKLFSDDFGFYDRIKESKSYGTLDFPTLYHFVKATLMSNGALLLLFFICLYPSNFKRELAAAVLLTFLTGKPQVALVGVFFLAACGRWRILFLSGGITFTVCLILTPLFGLGWPLDYITSISQYGTDSANPTIAGQIGIASMTNLRALLSGAALIPDSLACQISWLFMFGSALAIIAYTNLRHAIPTEYLFVFSSLIYLLFSPHLNGYEDVLLLPACILLLRRLDFRKTQFYVLLLFILIITNTSMGLRTHFTQLELVNHVFILKLLFTAYVAFRFIRSPKQEVYPA